MKLEVGKSYRTRDGRRVEIVKNNPISYFSYSGVYHLDTGEQRTQNYTEYGATSLFHLSEHDIIAEWPDEVHVNLRPDTAPAPIPPGRDFAAWFTPEALAAAREGMEL